jgi:hypothetical protein
LCIYESSTITFVINPMKDSTIPFTGWIIWHWTEKGWIWPDLLEGVEVFQRGCIILQGSGDFSPIKYLKPDLVLKCHFLHSEHYIYLLTHWVAALSPWRVKSFGIKQGKIIK